MSPLACAAVVLCLALLVTALASALGRRTYCLGDCRGRLVGCADVDRIARRAAHGDAAARRAVVRLRTAVQGFRAAECAGASWKVDTPSLQLVDALQRATDHRRPVTLTLRYLGTSADSPISTLEVLGIEVRGADDLESVLAALRGP